MYPSANGTIPSELATLQNLKRLILHHNLLQGAIPSELSKLKSMEIVQLHKNRLTGVSPNIEVSEAGIHAYSSDCTVNLGIKCSSCTMCCDPDDSDDKCHVNWGINLPMTLVLALPVIVPILLIIVIHMKLYSGRINMQTFAPKWTEHRIAEVEYIMKQKVPLLGVMQQESESKNSSIHEQTQDEDVFYECSLENSP